jgi:predicted ATPase
MNTDLAWLLLGERNELTEGMAKDIAEEIGLSLEKLWKFETKMIAEEFLFGAKIRYAATLSPVNFCDFIKAYRKNQELCKRLVTLDQVKRAIVLALTTENGVQIYLSPNSRHWKKQEQLEILKVLEHLNERKLLRQWKHVRQWGRLLLPLV